MPHFTQQFQTDGPHLQLYVGVSQPRQQALKDAGVNIPLPILIRGLVDTGPSITAIDSAVIQTLGLQPTGSMLVLTPSTGPMPVQVNTFDVGIVIPIQTSSFVLQALQIFERKKEALSFQGIQALIGRDVLSNSLLVYHGRSNIFSLAF